jgi:SWI/SNF-related matrix-associated actin-dependent regulator 1 of chromatin subfamily A
MALSTIIRKTCKECGKIAVEKSHIQFGGKKIVYLECGHKTSEEILQTNVDIASILNGCKLMPYQVKGVEFLQKADAKALLADEQGLGKTIQALALLKLHRDELLPCIIASPTTVKLQWHHEILDKCGVQGFLTQVIASNKELAAPGFDIYVTTYDLLKNEKCFDLVKDNIKTIILDECQRIKNHLSGRAKAVQKVCKNIEHIIPMSGTPIKNNAGEYFTVLNLIAPRLFPHYAHFIENDCDSYNNGYGYKVGGLRKPEQFHEKTKDFILRRTKAEVLPDLPELMRKFHHVEFDGKFKKAYLEQLDKLDDLMFNEEGLSAFAATSSKITIMTEMRKITGMAKVDNCVDFVIEFLESCDRKIVVFTHHHIATDWLIMKLNQYLTENNLKGCIHLSASLNGDERQNMAEKFKDNDDYRVMVASTLAAGEGINLQFCSDAVMMERQWNPANEEQAEGRFHRFGQMHPVSVSYMIASETIDEYFTELVESKRAIVASALDNKEIEWDQPSLMNELAKILVTKGKKAWKL